MAREKLQVILELVANQFKNETRGLSRFVNMFRNDLNSAGKSTTGLEQGMGRVGKAAGLALAGAAVGAAAAMTRELAMSVKAFAEFEQKMTQSLAIMGDVSHAMKGQMSDAAREVGRTTLFSASQAAEAYFYLASAGFSAEASIAAMPQVAKFAQAGMFDMALATDLATDAQSALGLKSADAAQNLTNLTRVTDVFVKANILANTSVEQISEAMTTKAGAALRALGKDVEEGSAVLAAFADQGVKGAEAGTQFSIVLRDLQTKALENTAEFREAGVAVFDAAGEMRNMADVIGDLEGALAGMSDAEKKSTLLNLGFSDKSVSAITTLLGTSDAIRGYEKALRSAGGLTEEVAGKQMESLSGQFELLKSAVNDTRIAVGEEMAPAFKELIPEIQQAVESLGEFAIAAGPAAAGAISGLLTLMEGAQEAFFQFRSGWETFLLELTNVPGTDFSFFGDRNLQLELRQQAALMELLGRIRRQGLTKDDRHAPTEFANSLVHLERQALLTEDSMESLARTFGLTTDETLDGLRAYEEWMAVHKQDIPTDQLQGWITGLENAAIASDILARDDDLYNTLHGIGDAADDNTEPVGEFGEVLAETADDALTLAVALERAAAAQESLADQILRFTSPVFAAVSAVQSVASAEEAITELEKKKGKEKATTQELAAAELDLIEARLQAQSALDALKDTGEDALDALSRGSNKSREDVEALLVTLGILTGSGGFEVVVRVRTEFADEHVRRFLEGERRYEPGDESTRAAPGPISAEDALAGIEGAQHQGGMVEAGKRYPVLRNEIFIPSQNGMVAPLGGGTTNNYVNVVVPLKDMSQFAAESARAIEQVLDRREKAVA